MSNEYQNEPTEDVTETSEEETFKPETTPVARKTMIGDLRDVVLNILRDTRYTGKAWKDMKEQEQRDVASMVTLQVEEAVVRAIDIIHSDGHKHIKAILEQVVVAVFKASKMDELRHELADAQGDSILVCLTNTDAYLGEREKVKFDKDQPELAVDQGHEEADVSTEPTEEEDYDETEHASAEGGEGLEQEAAQYT